MSGRQNQMSRIILYPTLAIINIFNLCQTLFFYLTKLNFIVRLLNLFAILFINCM